MGDQLYSCVYRPLGVSLGFRLIDSHSPHLPFPFLVLVVNLSFVIRRGLFCCAIASHTSHASRCCTGERHTGAVPDFHVETTKNDRSVCERSCQQSRLSTPRAGA